MNSQTLLNKPQPKIRVVAKVSKIGSLVEVSTKARKSSTALRKVFEKGSYQKRTQLSVLKRYKRRLDSIQNQNDKNVSRKSKQKIKLPPIKKYLGSFFSAGTSNDPLKSIGALAAFNAFQKGAKGDILGALGPALVFSGIAFGPSLLRGGINLARKKPQKITQVGVKGSTVGSFWGTPYAETKAGKAYAGMQAERNLPKWAQKAAGGSASRFAASNERIIQGTANVGDRFRIGARRIGMQGVGGAAETIASTKPSISPRVGLLNAALFGLDYMGRKSEGQTNLQAAAGAGAGVGGALIGAAIGSALFPGVGTVAGFLIGAAFSTGGALIASKLADTLTGADKSKKDKLQQKTEEQKKLVEKKEDGGRKLTFGKSLDRYEKNINKFEEFVKGFSGGMGMNLEQIRQTSATIEDLGGGSNPVSAAGYEFTQQSSFSQYLTGDVNAPKGTYDPSHGTSDNYHDHLAFKDRETALRAYNFLKSKGITVTELEGVDSSVTGPHSGSGSAHHRGLAFDVPGFQWGASGLIDHRHYKGSAKVRAFMNDFYNLETKPNQRQQSNESRNIVSYGNTLRKDVKDKLVDKGPISFQHNGETYNLYWTDMGPSIFKNKDPLGLTREYYDFSKKSNGTNVDANVGLQEAAIKKIESMYSNPTKSRSPNVPTSTPQLSRPAIPSRPIQQYLPYEQGYSSAQPTIVPYPVVQQSQPQMMQQESSIPSFMGGPSEQQVLNSFYKRVLLNTVA